MTQPDQPIAIRLPATALARLHHLAAAEGRTGEDLARRLLLAALGEPDPPGVQRAEASSLLDVDEDLTGP